MHMQSGLETLELRRVKVDPHHAHKIIFNLVDVDGSRKLTNCWGSAKRDVTHLTATVVYNACYFFVITCSENVHT